MPHFITDTCIGCGVCEIKCPTHTITGDKAEKYVIHADRCIDCSVCARYCPVSCIQDHHGELVMKVKPKDIPKAIVDRDLCTACEFCIDTTTRRAAALGYGVTLAADAHTTHDKPHATAVEIRAHENATLSDLTSFGPVITATPSADIVFP